MLETRTCTKCGKTKEADEFYQGQGNTCKTCIKEKSKEWKRDNPIRYRATRKAWEKDNLDLAVKRRKARLRKRYNLSDTRVEEMLHAQDYTCAVCGVPLQSPFDKDLPQEGTTKPVVDHDHNDGHVRGILCSACNSGLGLFEDNVEFLEKAIKYLETDHASTSAIR